MLLNACSRSSISLQHLGDRASHPLDLIATRERRHVRQPRYPVEIRPAETRSPRNWMRCGRVHQGRAGDHRRQRHRLAGVPDPDHTAVARQMSTAYTRWACSKGLSSKPTGNLQALIVAVVDMPRLAAQPAHQLIDRQRGQRRQPHPPCRRHGVWACRRLGGDLNLTQRPTIGTRSDPRRLIFDHLLHRRRRLLQRWPSRSP